MKLIDLENKYKTISELVYKRLELSGHPNFIKRYKHSVSVAEKAFHLANVHYKDDSLAEKAYLAGLIHDYCKYEKAENYCNVIKKNNLNIIYNDQVKSVYHGMLAPYFIKKELNITDVEILSAIEWHVTGKENMSPLEKIIYVSDYVEDLREGQTYAISRKIAEVNLDACVAYNSRSILQYLLEKKYAIFSSSIATYNYYIKYFDDYESK